MVAVVQWLEHWIVVPVVGGSSPLSHPIKIHQKGRFLADLAEKGLFYWLPGFSLFPWVSPDFPAFSYFFRTLFVHSKLYKSTGKELL